MVFYVDKDIQAALAVRGCRYKLRTSEGRNKFIIFPYYFYYRYVVYKQPSPFANLLFAVSIIRGKYVVFGFAVRGNTSLLSTIRGYHNRLHQFDIKFKNDLCFSPLLLKTKNLTAYVGEIQSFILLMSFRYINL